MKRGASRLGGWFTARGLKARMRLLKGKAVREAMPPERVAAGWGIGMFVGCTVPFGLQLMVSVPLAIVTKTSKIGATAATFVTNPFTIFFIYPAQCWAGSRLIGAPLGWSYLSGEVLDKLRQASVFSKEGLDVILELGGRVMGGFFAGGLLLAALLTPPTYFAVLRAVKAARARKEGAKR